MVRHVRRRPGEEVACAVVDVRGNATGRGPFVDGPQVQIHRHVTDICPPPFRAKRRKQFEDGILDSCDAIPRLP